MKKQGILTAMLTGDAQENARAVAEKTGVDEIYARLLPQDKVQKLVSIRQKHGSVMFVGDGIKDVYKRQERRLSVKKFQIII